MGLVEPVQVSETQSAIPAGEQGGEPAPPARLTMRQAEMLREIQYLQRQRGWSFASQAHLASVLGISDRQVRKILRKLVDLRLLQATGTRGRIVRYRLSVDGGKAVETAGLPRNSSSGVPRNSSSYPGRNSSSYVEKKNIREGEAPPPLFDQERRRIRFNPFVPLYQGDWMQIPQRCVRAFKDEGRFLFIERDGKTLTIADMKYNDRGLFVLPEGGEAIFIATREIGSAVFWR